MSALEKSFQKNVIKKIKERYPNAIVMKTDPTYIQGIPDLIVLQDSSWFALECKRNKKAHRQPNQEHYVNKMNEMSFARFIYPENAKEVFDDIQHTFSSRR